MEITPCPKKKGSIGDTCHITAHASRKLAVIVD